MRLDITPALIRLLTTTLLDQLDQTQEQVTLTQLVIMQGHIRTPLTLYLRLLRSLPTLTHLDTTQVTPTQLATTQGTALIIIHLDTILQGPITLIIKALIQATPTRLVTTLGTTVVVVIAGLLFIQATLTHLDTTQVTPTHLDTTQGHTITPLDHTVRTLR